jgi:hypothetical protein
MEPSAPAYAERHDIDYVWQITDSGQDLAVA